MSNAKAVKRKQQRQRRLERGLCLDCGNPLHSKLYCKECLYKMSVKNKSYYSGRAEELKERGRARRKQRREEGKCVRCGNPNASPYCNWCKTRR
jgi:hypothetical protein